MIIVGALVGIVVASFVGAFGVVALGGVFTFQGASAGFIGSLIMYLSMLTPAVLIVTLVIGGPMIWVLRKYNCNKLNHYRLMGASIGFLFIFIPVVLSIRDVVEIAKNFSAGMLVGAVCGYIVFVSIWYMGIKDKSNNTKTVPDENGEA